MAGHPLVLRTFRFRLPPAAPVVSATLVGRLAACVALCGVLASVSCVDAVTPGGDRHALVSLQPRFSARDAAIYYHLAAVGVPVTSVRIILVRPPSDTVANTTVSVDPGADSLSVDVTVNLKSDPETFDASMDLLNAGTVLFHGTGSAIGYGTRLPNQQTGVVTIKWVGPGANAARVQITPGDTSIVATTSLALSATSYDSSNNVISDPAYTSRYEWHVTDTTFGTIPLHGGSFTGKGKFGSVDVWVEDANLLRDTVTLTLTPPIPVPTTITLAHEIEVLDKSTTLATTTTVLDQFGNPMTGVPITYTSRDTTRATVNSAGVLSGVRVGQTVVVATVTGKSLSDSLLAVVAPFNGIALISSIDRFSYPIDTTLTVSIYVDMRNSGRKLGSTTVDVTWNPAQLQYVSNANGGSGVQPTVNSTNASSGTLTLAMADVNGFTGKVELLRITFTAAHTITSGQLQLSARAMHSANYTDLLPLTVMVTHPLTLH